jgi:hypothetical protein
MMSLPCPAHALATGKLAGHFESYEMDHTAWFGGQDGELPGLDLVGHRPYSGGWQQISRAVNATEDVIEGPESPLAGSILVARVSDLPKRQPVGAPGQEVHAQQVQSYFDGGGVGVAEPGPRIRLSPGGHPMPGLTFDADEPEGCC